jgi:small-conductance mechanosensitive channel
MAEEDLTSTISSVGQFQSVSELIISSTSLQITFAVLIIGIIAITIVYRKFASWVRAQKFNYTRPHLSHFVQVAILPFFAIALVSSINVYIQVFELFDEITPEELKDDKLNAAETFAKILNTINILVIGYTIAHIIPIFIDKRERSILEYKDFQQWKEMRGFADDEDDLFHKLFRWIPPAKTPDELEEEEFKDRLQTKEGREFLENFRNSKGLPIGSYQALVKDPFSEWKNSEQKKYEKYYQDCISGNNEAGRPLKPGLVPEEIYTIDIWKEEKRYSGYEPIIAGSRPPGYAEKKREGVPKSVKRIIPIGIFAAIIIGVVSWWGVDLVVLATATGGLAIGIGLALQETMKNYFAYIMIRKDKVFVEGDRVQLESGYNGYVHKITPRVTYIRDALHESIAIIPTLQLVNSQMINFSKELKSVPAKVEVGVSYLNNPKQVAAILMMVGKRAMKEVVDPKGRHMVIQHRCPYLDENRPSCGCDKEIHVELGQPVVRFNKFNDSSLDFSMWVFAREYGDKFKIETDMRVMIYEEFKKNDIRIPWPIRTIYQGDERKEEKEISQLDDKRNKILDEHGVGDLLDSDK